MLESRGSRKGACCTLLALEECADTRHLTHELCAAEGQRVYTDHPMTFTKDFNMKTKDTERANTRRERASCASACRR